MTLVYQNTHFLPQICEPSSNSHPHWAHVNITCPWCWWGVISSPFYVGEKTCLGTVVYFTIRANFVGIFFGAHTKHTHKNTWRDCQRDEWLEWMQEGSAGWSFTWQSTKLLRNHYPAVAIFNNGQANKNRTEKETEIGSKTLTSFLFISLSLLMEE